MASTQNEHRDGHRDGHGNGDGLLALLALPPELVHLVAFSGWLGVKDVAALSQTCHHMASILVWDEYGNNIHHALNGVLPNVKAHNWKAALYAITRKWFAADDKGEEGVWQEVAETVVGYGKTDLDADDDLTGWENVMVAALSLPEARGWNDLWPLSLSRFSSAETSLLHAAAIVGSVRLTEWVLERGGDLEVTTDEEETPLFAACRAGNLEIVCMLVDGGADPTVNNDGAESLLHTASQNGHAELVHYLLGLGVLDVDAEDENQEPPLYQACESGYLDVVKVLVEEGRADVDVEGRAQKGPLYWATWGGHDIVRFLVDAGSGSGLGKDGGVWLTSLMLAAREGYVHVLRLLLGEGVPVNLVDETGTTPLCVASREGHADAVRILIDEGRADANLAGNLGRRPLHLACERGNEDVVRVLLEGGADVGIKTGLEIARRVGWMGVVGLLEDWIHHQALHQHAHQDALEREKQEQV